jgi:putative ABC transport system permease protein
MPSASLIKTSLRDLTRRGWQLALMILGVALGVAVVVAINLANQSATQGFALSTQAVVGKATHQVRGGPSGIPASVCRLVRVDLGIGASAPVVEGHAQAPAWDGQTLRILGIDPLAEAPFRSYFDQVSATQNAFVPFFTKPGGVLVPQALADGHGLAPGDSFELAIGGRREDVTVLGVMSQPGKDGQPLPEDLLVMDVGTAQELLGMPESLTRIDLIATPEQASRVQEALPAGLTVVSASQESATAAQLASAFQLNLTALSLLALVVGMFLIYNSVMFSVVQRRTVLATLRALGATGGQLFSMVCLEALLVGLLGAGIGLGLGWILAQGAVRLETQTINDFYFVVAVRQVTLTLGDALKGLLLGGLASVAAAAGPAVEAARVQPAEALRPSTLETRVRTWVPWLSLLGLGLSIVGAAILLAVTDSLAASFAGMFAILFGLALLVPAATVALCRLASPGLGAVFGRLGVIAARTVDRALSRTSVAIAALMVALSVTIGVGVMIDGFRGTVVHWLDLTLRADVYVSAPAAGDTRPTASLPSDLADTLRGVPSVDAVETFRGVTVQGTDGPVRLSVTDARRERAAGLYRFASGTPNAMWDAVLQGSVIVSEPYAYRHGIASGAGSVRLLTDQGWRTFPIVGVYYDYASDRGTVLMADTVYHRYWRDRSISSLGVYLAPGADLQRATRDISASLAGMGLVVQPTRALREQALHIFDRTFAITAALRLLAIVVAFVGVLSALLALQLERRPELATLMALGLTEGGLWTLSLIETGIVGAIAGVCSVPTGLILAAVLTYVINLRSFGWTIQWSVDPWILISAIAIGIAAAMLAGVYPIRRLSRMSIVDGLRME